MSASTVIAHELPRLVFAVLYVAGAVYAVRSLLLARARRQGTPLSKPLFAGVTALLLAAHAAAPYWLFYPLSLAWKYKPVTAVSVVTLVAVLGVTLFWVVAFVRAVARAPQVDREALRAARTRELTTVETRRRFVVEGTRIVLAAGTLGAVAAGVANRKELRIARVRVNLPWPRELSGLKIVQLSDVHIDQDYDLAYLRRIVEAINGEKPDLFFFTGDLSSQTGRILDDACAELAKIKVNLSALACLGNHDYYGNAKRVEKALAQCGLPPLNNHATRVVLPGSKLHVLGITDPQAPRFGGDAPDIAQAMRFVPDGAQTILLSHQPQFFDEAAEKGIHLTLSGHTHGGQIAISRDLNPARSYTRYTYGLYKEGDSLLYVTSGTGTVGVPMRLGMPPEIAVIEVG